MKDPMAEQLREQNILRDIDIYFAESICEIFDVQEHFLLFAVLFNSSDGGHTCLNLRNLTELSYYEDNQIIIDTNINENAVKELIQKKVIAEAPSTEAPFIYDNGKLYLKTFYMDETTIAGFIRESVREKIDMERLKTLLDKYFPENSMQKVAALTASLMNFCVISGGPGTGKTTTVFNILAIQQELSENTLSIAVCAPTGKAASRLSESIKEKKKNNTDKNITDSIPDKALTIHRLLGISGDNMTGSYSRGNPMKHDIVVVDEASMVDVQMMAGLIRSLKPDCRLILLGDKDQLASVQPGAVLGDICTFAPVNIFSKETATVIKDYTGYDMDSSGDSFSDSTVELDVSHRFDDDKGIGLLAKSCRNADTATALKLLKNDPSGQVDFIRIDGDFEINISDMILEHFQRYTAKSTPEKVISEFNSFRILSAHKRQFAGVDHINTTAYKSLSKNGLRDNTKQFFNGMPLIISENDYTLNLFNGDTGLILREEDTLKAYFTTDSGIKSFSTARLPEHSPVFAMTVHKSQGSEFEHVVFVLPDMESSIMTRELFYTAVTRARTKLTVISSESAVKRCIENKMVRSTSSFSSGV
jgi:exodeoxyribonuclease V alpha subunit